MAHITVPLDRAGLTRGLGSHACQAESSPVAALERPESKNGFYTSKWLYKYLHKLLDLSCWPTKPKIFSIQHLKKKLPIPNLDSRDNQIFSPDATRSRGHVWKVEDCV